MASRPGLVRLVRLEAPHTSPHLSHTSPHFSQGPAPEAPAWADSAPPITTWSFPSHNHELISGSPA